MLLAGCSVEIDPSNAVARLATSADIRNDAEASAGEPSGVGAWVLLTAVIDRNDARRVFRWEVYPHVYIVECATGKETNVGSEPRLDGTDFAHTRDVEALLKGNPAQQTFRMQSLFFAREGDFRTPQCLQFRAAVIWAKRLLRRRFPSTLAGGYRRPLSSQAGAFSRTSIPRVKVGCGKNAHMRPFLTICLRQIPDVHSY
jgi:hypothetical protein